MIGATEIVFSLNPLHIMTLSQSLIDGLLRAAESINVSTQTFTKTTVVTPSLS